MRAQPSPWLIILWLLSLHSPGLAGPAAAEVFDFDAEPLPGDFYTTVLFRMYWPDELDRVRAVYFYINPLNTDSRFIVDDPGFRAVAPLFMDGWSWGGQFGYHFTKWRPDRILGFVTIINGIDPVVVDCPEPLILLGGGLFESHR